MRVDAGHPLGDLAPQPDEPDLVRRVGPRPGAAAGRGARRRRSRSRSAWVTRPAGPEPCTSREIDAEVPRPLPNGGRRDAVAAGRHLAASRCRRCGAASAWRRRRLGVGGCGRLGVRVAPAARRPASRCGGCRRLAALPSGLDADEVGADGEHVAGLAVRNVTTPATGDEISTVALSVITSASTDSARDLVADRDVPLDELGLGDALADIGKLDDVNRSSSRPPSSRSSPRRGGPGPGSRSTRARAGTACPSRRPARSALRASRSSRSCTIAHSSAPKPDVSVASWATTQRPVLRPMRRSCRCRAAPACAGR